MQAKPLVFTFLFCNSAIFLIVSPPTSLYVGKNPQGQSVEQHYSWESLSSFVRSFHIEKNKEKSRVTYRSILLEPFFIQQEGREQRHPASVHLSSCSAQMGLWMWQNMFTMLSSEICQDKTRFWLLGRRMTGIGGRISCCRQSCVTLFALAGCPFIYMNLQPFFTVRGHPLESLFQKEICLNFDENCHVTSLS